MEAPAAGCPSCGAAALPDAAFCSECGAALGQRCASCDRAIPHYARFCPHCGAPNAGSVAPREPEDKRSAQEIPHGERRHRRVVDPAGRHAHTSSGEVDGFFAVLQQPLAVAVAESGIVELDG